MSLTLSELIIWHQNQVDMQKCPPEEDKYLFLITKFHLNAVELLKFQKGLNDIMDIHFRLLQELIKTTTSRGGN